jgi:putative transposase
MSRGDRREAIALDDADRQLWVETLGNACRKCDWQVHAYCLMSNHFHLVLETPLANLVAGMKWFLGTYTVRFNVRHKLRGHLFAGRYKSLLVDESDDHYLRMACDYVHLNPARAGLVAGADELERYAWSSYPAYLGSPRQRPRWLRTDRLLGEHGVAEETRAARLEFRQRMESQRRAVADGEMAASLIRRGWRLGGEAFLRRLLDKLEGRLNENHRALERTEALEEKVERIVEAGLREIGWSEKNLEATRKCAPEKVRIARRLRDETTVSLKQVAERLRMGKWTNVSKLLYEAKKV